jgi:hypothetical protein
LDSVSFFLVYRTFFQEIILPHFKDLLKHHSKDWDLRGITKLFVPLYSNIKPAIMPSKGNWGKHVSCIFPLLVVTVPGFTSNQFTCSLSLSTADEAQQTCRPPHLTSASQLTAVLRSPHPPGIPTIFFSEVITEIKILPQCVRKHF